MILLFHEKLNSETMSESKVRKIYTVTEIEAQTLGGSESSQSK